MNIYLKIVKDLVKDPNKPVCVVIGNESVDLDSAVSSISLAYYLNNVEGKSQVIPAARRSEQLVFVPVINATREQLPFKTEVTHWLIKRRIELNNLLCINEIRLEGNVQNFVLVDHHVTHLRDNVIAVLDHRPFDTLSNLRSDCFTKIQEVGSCATLVCDVIKSDISSANNYKETFQLLYGPIVLDTINFSKEADKVRPLDIEMVEYIENILEIEKSNRKAIYDELVAARADVSSLNSLQLLSKDLKIISSDDGRVRVAIPGVDVFQYIAMENASENVKIFAQRGNIDVVVLMGMRPKGDSVERFMGVIDIKNDALFKGVRSNISTEL